MRARRAVESVDRHARIVKHRVACDDEIGDALALRFKAAGGTGVHDEIERLLCGEKRA